MKHFEKIIWLCFLLPAGVQAQPFEGKITYTNSYKSKMPNVTDEQFTAMMGTRQEYFIKGENFKSVTNGSFFQWQLYINKDNKLYNKVAANDAILWMDATVNADEVLKSEIRKGSITVLGHVCDELILSCRSGTQKYYFNPAIAVDPAVYANFKFGNWYDFISRTKALPLKMIVETPQFTITSEAIAIEKSVIDPGLFTLPAGVAIEKSPY